MLIPQHNIEQIKHYLKQCEDVPDIAVHYYKEINSTNSWLLNQAQCHHNVCLAEYQTQGRGRRGKQWSAPPSSSILMSLGWRIAAKDIEGLSLVVGLLEFMLHRLPVEWVPT